MGNIAKIEELEQQIAELKHQDVVENRAQILPLLVEGCKLIYKNKCFGRMDVVFTNKEIEKKVITLMEGNDTGRYHFGCYITDKLNIQFSDGDISLAFDFRGEKIPDIAFIEQCKNLGLKVDFSKKHAQINRDIQRYKDELTELEKTEALFNER